VNGNKKTRTRKEQQEINNNANTQKGGMEFAQKMEQIANELNQTLAKHKLSVFEADYAVFLLQGAMTSSRIASKIKQEIAMSMAGGQK